MEIYTHTYMHRFVCVEMYKYLTEALIGSEEVVMD